MRIPKTWNKVLGGETLLFTAELVVTLAVFTVAMKFAQVDGNKLITTKTSPVFSKLTSLKHCFNRFPFPIITRFIPKKKRNNQM